MKTAQAGADPPTWGEQLIRRLTGEEGAGYGTSLILHLVLMAIFAIPIIRQAEQGPIFSTEVTVSEIRDDLILESPIVSELPSPKAGSGSMALVPMDALNGEKIIPITKALLSDAASAEGDEAADGPGGGGIHLFEPENAVRKGSFSAWTTPVGGRRFGEVFKPGDAPRPQQDYRITVQIRLPPGRKTYPIRDLSGDVVGTDGYTQIIPAKAYVVNSNGNLVKPAGSIRVVDDAVQIVFLVPGASALVRDVIQVKSRMLNEEQTLELVFTPDRP